jgi:hypothetical protein
VPKNLMTGVAAMTLLDMRGGAFNDAFRKGLIKPELESPTKSRRPIPVRLYSLAEVERFRRVRAEDALPTPAPQSAAARDYRRG